MGQIPNKTFTAPDGSVYRVEEDGSLKKIKSAKEQKEDTQSKYQITPDGKIYRIESDGSVTYLGNAEEKSPSSDGPKSKVIKAKEPKPKSTKSRRKVWPWILGIVIFVLLCCFFVAGLNDRSYDPEQTHEMADSTPAWSYAEETVIDTSMSYTIDTMSYTMSESPATADAYFDSYESRTYYCYDGSAYCYMYFYDNGWCDIYYDGNFEDSGSYYPEGQYISFSGFDNWPNDQVYLSDDDSFIFAGMRFDRN